MYVILTMLCIMLISFSVGHLLDPANTEHRGSHGFMLALNLNSLFALLPKLHS